MKGEVAIIGVGQHPNGVYPDKTCKDLAIESICENNIYFIKIKKFLVCG